MGWERSEFTVYLQKPKQLVCYYYWPQIFQDKYMFCIYLQKYSVGAKSLLSILDTTLQSTLRKIILRQRTEYIHHKTKLYHLPTHRNEAIENMIHMGNC